MSRGLSKSCHGTRPYASRFLYFAACVSLLTLSSRWLLLFCRGVGSFLDRRTYFDLKSGAAERALKLRRKGWWDRQTSLSCTILTSFELVEGIQERRDVLQHVKAVFVVKLHAECQFCESVTGLAEDMT